LKQLFTDFKHISKIVLGIIAVDGYSRSRINDDILAFKESNRATKMAEAKLARASELQEQLQIKSDKLSMLKTKFYATSDRVSIHIKNLEENRNKIKKLESDDNSAYGNEELIAEVRKYSEKIVERISSEWNDFVTSTDIDSIDTTIKKIQDASANSNESSKLMNDFFENITKVFDSLSTEQLGAIGHVFLAIGLYYCVINISISYYGEILIQKYNIEKKFPSIAGWIQLRRKFQHYYIGWNLFLILFIAGYVAYVHISVYKYL
jgi:hypothetical protein